MINKDNSDIFPKCFTLKSCPGYFVLLDSKIVKYYIEDECVSSYDAVAHYYNEDLVFDLILIQSRNDIQLIDRIDIVLKALVPSMYKYLTDSINSHEGMKAIIRHEFGNTSEIILIWDQYGEDTLISMELMEFLVEQAQNDPFKYMQIKNGKVRKIIIDDMFIKI